MGMEGHEFVVNVPKEVEGCEGGLRMKTVGEDSKLSRFLERRKKIEA